MTFQGLQVSWSTVALRGLLFALLWWMLTGGAASSWWIGVPALVMAVIVSIALLPTTPLVGWEVLKLIPFFLRYSLQGGADVAWRVFQPRMPIMPTIIAYPLRLPVGLPQVIFCNIVSLLPGTLSAGLAGQILQIHVLDGQGNYLAVLNMLERRVARMCNVPLDHQEN